jgi:cell division protein FtsL
MIRPTNLVIFAAVACIGFGVFRVKHEVQELQEEYGRINRQIVAERNAMHVLKAEWSYLNQPQRLAEMARRHLDLQPVGTVQLGRVDAIPMKPGATGAPAVPLIAEFPPQTPSSFPGTAAKPPQVAVTLAAATKVRAVR